MNKVLVIGACGQIGTELCAGLRAIHGKDRVIAADIKTSNDTSVEIRPYVQLNVLDKIALYALILQEKITEVYHLAATLSATAEQHPSRAWELNMQGLLNVLDIAKTDRIKIFWPSSIAVFGPNNALEPTTVYGISKLAGEFWCKYYYDQYGVDVRSIRYPGLISHSTMPGGGTTDYAVDIFHQALKAKQYICYLKPHTALPMMYMPDAVRATLELMQVPASEISVRTSYSIHALSFTPAQLGKVITEHLGTLKITYEPDKRQQIAESWPASVDDGLAKHDWGWRPEYDLEHLVADMITQLQRKSI